MCRTVLMRHPLWLGLFVVGVVFFSSGCARFHRSGPRGDYALAPNVRPLEVPPDFVLPAAESSAMGGSSRSARKSESDGTSPQIPSQTVFTVRHDADTVFSRVGQVLGQTLGVTIVSQAQAIASYDVLYQQVRFIVRVDSMDNGESEVSVVDARGEPAQAPVAIGLLARIKAAIAQMPEPLPDKT